MRTFTHIQLLAVAALSLGVTQAREIEATFAIADWPSTTVPSASSA